MGVSSLVKRVDGKLICKSCSVDTINDTGSTHTVVKKVVQWWKQYNVKENYDAVVIEQQFRYNKKMMKLAGWFMVLCENDGIPLHILPAWEKAGYPQFKEYGTSTCDKIYKVKTLHHCIQMIENQELMIEQEEEIEKWIKQKSVTRYTNANKYFDMADSMMQGVYFLERI